MSQPAQPWAGEATSTGTAGLETTKLHWNSTISSPGARYLTIGISNMYLSTVLGRLEYMKFHLKGLLQEATGECGLQDKAGASG